MSTLMRCSRGHTWDWAEFGDYEPPTDSSIACPLCGAMCVKSGDPPASFIPAAATHRGDVTQGNAPPRDAPPAFLGYTIMSELGRGGMGVVYKARHLKTDRVVALKVPEYFDLETRCRFATEAKAAARLSHPNIVQVYEVGEQDGKPFLALEFCPGGSLADRLGGKPMTAPAAAELMEGLARAVGAAHAAGVVHRDLKPGNILLAGSGDSPLQPKVADFGLARRVDADTSQTRSGMILGTPDYMAPEQTTGDSSGIGPPADIYALGAMLYELLTGRPPFRGASMLETLEHVRSQDPVPPARLQPSVPRDLDTICMKCLHKEPARRYATAGDLADDLRRFLSGHPVLARPVSLFEKSVKRIRRNPIAATLAAGLCLVLLATAAYGVWYHFRLQAQRDRARYHFQMSVRSIEEMLTEVAEEDLAPEPRAELKRKALLEKALRFYEELLQVETDDPVLAWHAARAARRVGDIQRLLGRHAESLSAYESALTRLRPLTDSPPPGTDPQREVADCHTFIGEVHRARGEKTMAEASYRKALDIQQPLHEASPDHLGYRQDLARTRYNLGIVARQTGRPAVAVSEFAEATRLLDEVPQGDASHRRHRARVYLNLGPALRATGDLPGAEQACNQAVELLDALAAEHRFRQDYRFELSAALINLGTVRLTAQDLVGAKAPLERARDLLEALFRDFPSTPGYRAELARVCNTLAALAFPARDAAAILSARAVELWEGLVAAHPDEAEYHGELGISLGNFGRARYRTAEARALLTRGIAEVLVGLKRNASEPAFRGSLRQQIRDLAALLVLAGDHEAAYRMARDLARGLPDRTDGTQHAVCFLAGCVAEAGRKDLVSEADRYAELAASLVREASPADWTPLVNDPDCAPLLAREEFAKLVRSKK